MFNFSLDYDLGVNFIKFYLKSLIFTLEIFSPLRILISPRNQVQIRQFLIPWNWFEVYFLKIPFSPISSIDFSSDLIKFEDYVKKLLNSLWIRHIFTIIPLNSWLILKIGKFGIIFDAILREIDDLTVSSRHGPQRARSTAQSECEAQPRRHKGPAPRQVRGRSLGQGPGECKGAAQGGRARRNQWQARKAQAQVQQRGGARAAGRGASWARPRGARGTAARRVGRGSGVTQRTVTRRTGGDCGGAVAWRVGDECEGAGGTTLGRTGDGMWSCTCGWQRGGAQGGAVRRAAAHGAAAHKAMACRAAMACDNMQS